MQYIADNKTNSLTKFIIDKKNSDFIAKKI